MKISSERDQRRAGIRPAAISASLRLVIILSMMGSALAEPRAQEQRVVASLRAGVEHDDNALRSTREEVEADLLTRYFASVDLALRARRSLTLLSVSQGGKLFQEVAAADMLLTQLGLVWRRELAGGFYGGAWLDVKDRTERASIQDYQRGGAMAGLGWRATRVELDARAGWRAFAYKPNPSASAVGPALITSARQWLSPQLALSQSYILMERRFESPQLVAVDQADDTSAPMPGGVPLRATQDTRRDLFHAGQAGVSWRGAALVELHYTHSLNTSNSYGQELRRHNLSATVTAPLPLKLFVSAHAELQRTRYDSPMALDAAFLVDEENRNMATLSLARTLGERWDVELRASLYAQEFGAGDPYRRRTIMLGMGYAFDSGE